MALEAIKRATVAEITIQWLKKSKVQAILLLIALTCSAISIFSTVESSSNIADMKVPPPNLVDLDSISNVYDRTLSELSHDKRIGENIRWKGTITRDGRDLIRKSKE